jgi:hypothetical protein
MGRRQSGGRRKHRYALRDDQWDKIKDFLPGREGHVGGTAADNRLFVDAVIYRYRTGIPWRDLPERYVIGRLFTDVIGDGAKVAFSCGFLRFCPAMATTSL